MLKSRGVILFLSVVPVFVACGDSLTVQVVVDGTDGQRAVDNHEVQFLPFDRDSLFAVITAQASEPEPQMPADLQRAADSTLALQETWRQAEARWNGVRDSLRTIGEQLQGLDRRGREYRELFDRFNSVEGREGALDRQRQRSFDAFTGLQEATPARVASFNAVLQAWEDLAFSDYGQIEDDLLEALGRQLVFDTTNADGYITRSLSGGPWWVHSRANVAAGELYWNVITEGAADTLQLNPTNAELRRQY